MAAIDKLLVAFAEPPDPCHSESEKSVLGELFCTHTGLLVHKWPHYFPIYERHLERFRESAVRVLEIGVSQGGSLQLWRKYFGTRATIFGIDIDPRCAAIQDTGVTVRIGSQADPEFLRTVVNEMKGVDVVIDDGSHLASHQRLSFSTLFPRLDPNGVYIVEDLQTSYWPPFEGGVGKSGTFVEEMKLLIDDLHAWYSNDIRQQVPGAHQVIDSVHFYDSMVVIEKRPKTRPFHAKAGTPQFGQ